MGGQRNSRRPSASRGGAVDRLAELPFAIQSHRRRATSVLRWSRRPRADSRSADWRDRSFRRNGGGTLGHCRLSDADEARNPSLSCASPDRPVRVWARTDQWGADRRASAEPIYRDPCDGRGVCRPEPRHHQRLPDPAAWRAVPGLRPGIRLRRPDAGAHLRRRRPHSFLGSRAHPLWT